MNFTRISSYFFTRMYPYVSRMLVVCYSYVSVCSVCYLYVTRMLLVCYPYVLVWCFSHDPSTQQNSLVVNNASCTSYRLMISEFLNLFYIN